MAIWPTLTVGVLPAISGKWSRPRTRGGGRNTRLTAHSRDDKIVNGAVMGTGKGKREEGTIMEGSLSPAVPLGHARVSCRHFAEVLLGWELGLGSWHASFAGLLPTQPLAAGGQYAEHC